jgi:hypothetical protein
MSAPSQPEGEHRSLLGYTSLKANRTAMLLVAAGAHAAFTGQGSARLEVKGAAMTVLAGDRTRVIVESADPERRRKVALVAEQRIQREDPAFSLAGSHAVSPEPSPLPTSPLAGWYHDPYRPSGLRRWDGLAWSADVSDS